MAGKKRRPTSQMNLNREAARRLDEGFENPITELVKRTDHRTLAFWAADCAERLLPLFEKDYPMDARPKEAIRGLREFARTGRFSMNEVRRLSLACHAAAREAPKGSAASYAARAIGQAIATAHAPLHALGPAAYAPKAIKASDPENAEIMTSRERAWQYEHLLELKHDLEGHERMRSPRKLWRG
ncbi:MAG TPA: hypothetical protein VMB46_07260 [Methanomassiliicoccales archaeon]|nr:hypothetical protein [Methanomassiliicoccales archaeon]